jgi:hypothetical protein
MKKTIVQIEFRQSTLDPREDILHDLGHPVLSLLGGWLAHCRYGFGGSIPSVSDRTETLRDTFGTVKHGINCGARHG